jgi:hypothetical protein
MAEVLVDHAAFDLQDGDFDRLVVFENPDLGHEVDAIDLRSLDFDHH